MRILLSTILLLLIIFIGSVSADEINSSNNVEPHIVKMNDYSYRAYYYDRSTSVMTNYFEIYHKGRKVYSEQIKDGDFSIVERNSDILSEDSRLPLSGKDINGDGIPKFVLERYVGGAKFKGRYSYTIYSLGKKVKKFATLEGDYSPMYFVDLDGDGRYEVIGHDWVFAYFFWTSPHPVVILKWQADEGTISHT